MTKRIIIWSIILLTLGFGARSCYYNYRNAFYEYISVINFTNEEKRTVQLDESILMETYCQLNEGGSFSTFEINLKFSDIKAEAIIQKLDIKIISIGKDDQIKLDYVIGHKDTINAENFDHSKIKAKNFELLPAIGKRISADRDFNGLSFNYRTEVKPLSEKFILIITGEIFINGKKITLNKKLNICRTKEWVEIQMMT
jgi:hypothetical protein